MKEFNLEKAKEGAPVCTRDGRPARIVCWDVKDVNYSILALAKADNGNESVMLYTNDGKYFIPELNVGSYDSDLMMAPVKREGWVLICPVGPQCIAHIYDTKEEAEEDAEREMITYSAIAHIEWEE